MAMSLPYRGKATDVIEVSFSIYVVQETPFTSVDHDWNMFVVAGDMLLL
jgi:hypothetical protein